MNLTKENLTQHVASNDCTRQHLQRLELSHAGAISTDGHRMLCTPFDASGLPEGVSIALSVDDAATIAKTMKKGDLAEIDVPDTMANGHVRIRVRGAQHDVPKPAGEFPSWDAVVPKDQPTVRVGFNAKYLAELCKALAACDSSGKAPIVELELFGEPSDLPNRPMRLKSSATGAWALLMPCRI